MLRDQSSSNVMFISLRCLRHRLSPNMIEGALQSDPGPVFAPHGLAVSYLIRIIAMWYHSIDMN